MNAEIDRVACEAAYGAYEARLAAQNPEESPDCFGGWSNFRAGWLARTRGAGDRDVEAARLRVALKTARRLIEQHHACREMVPGESCPHCSLPNGAERFAVREIDAALAPAPVTDASPYAPDTERG